MNSGDMIQAKNMKISKFKKIITPVVLIVAISAIFLVSSYFADIYSIEIQNSIGEGSIGLLLFFLINILAVVLAPFTTLPLIPIASALWGWFLTGIFLIISWTIGSQIAFYLSRRFGRKLVVKFINIDKLNILESRIPKENVFWSLVLLRMIVPVDVLSYAVGLFSKIKNKLFISATFVGIIPFAFIFAYVGTLPTKIQLIVAIEIIAAVLVMLIYKKSSAKKILLFLLILSISSTLFVYRSEIIPLFSGLSVLSKERPLLTSVILIVAKTVSTPLGFPGTPLTLLSGSLFGKLFGTVIALIGNTMGATLAFILSRYIFRNYVQKKVLPNYPRITQYEKRFEERAFSTVFLLRLIPIFPFNGLNFLLGVTNIPIKKYVIGSFIGMIPGTALFVYFGESLGSMSLINILLALGGIVLLTYVGKKYEKRF